MSYAYREKLEKKIKEVLETAASDFVDSRSDSVYEMGESRGLIRGLKLALEMCGDVERAMNNEQSSGFSSRNTTNF